MTHLTTLNYRLSFLPIEAQRKFVLETIAHLNPIYETYGTGVYTVIQVDDIAAALALADWPMPPGKGVNKARWRGEPPAPYGAGAEPGRYDIAGARFEPGGYGEAGLRSGETVVRLSQPYPDGKPTAPDILQRAAKHMQDRAAARDQAGGERSMRRTVDAFNALTGHNVSERDGWLFMAVLKMARATTTPTGAPDDYEDLAAYAALAGESAQENKA